MLVAYLSNAKNVLLLIKK